MNDRTRNILRRIKNGEITEVGHRGGVVYKDTARHGAATLPYIIHKLMLDGYIDEGPVLTEKGERGLTQ